MRVNPGESYLDILPPDYWADDDALVAHLRAEFNAMEEASGRDPRDWLINELGDELVAAAYLVCQGQREEGVAAFLRWIDTARDKYVEEYADEVDRVWESRRRRPNRFCAADYDTED